MIVAPTVVDISHSAGCNVSNLRSGIVVAHTPADGLRHYSHQPDRAMAPAHAAADTMLHQKDVDVYSACNDDPTCARSRLLVVFRSHRVWWHFVVATDNRHWYRCRVYPVSNRLGKNSAATRATTHSVILLPSPRQQSPARMLSAEPVLPENGYDINSNDFNSTRFACVRTHAKNNYSRPAMVGSHS